MVTTKEEKMVKKMAVRERLAELRTLKHGWVETEDGVVTIPPSHNLCGTVELLLEGFEDEDLQIFPIEVSPGIELYFQKKGVSLSFYDKTETKPERFRFICVGCSQLTETLSGQIDEYIPTNFNEFIRDHLRTR